MINAWKYLSRDEVRWTRLVDERDALRKLIVDILCLGCETIDNLDDDDGRAFRLMARHLFDLYGVDWLDAGWKAVGIEWLSAIDVHNEFVRLRAECDDARVWARYFMRENARQAQKIIVLMRSLIQ